MAASSEDDKAGKSLLAAVRATSVSVVVTYSEPVPKLNVPERTIAEPDGP
jgi:hypothetical protein